MNEGVQYVLHLFSAKSALKEGVRSRGLDPVSNWPAGPESGGPWARSVHLSPQVHPGPRALMEAGLGVAVRANLQMGRLDIESGAGGSCPPMVPGT